MKKLTVIMLVLVTVVLCACSFGVEKAASNRDFLRIHIRADSNEVADQNVKYDVKNAVVDYLTPRLANVTSKEQAMQVVASNLEEIQSVANRILEQNGFDYTSTASLCNEAFPARAYDGVVLDAGVYDALIVNLGSGNGDNWWCVVYPPLCFVPSQSDTGNPNVVFRFKILEIIKNWKNSR